MTEIEQEKIALMKYLKYKTFKTSLSGTISKTECWEISINPGHLYNLLMLLSKNGYFIINETTGYIDLDGYNGDRNPECNNGEDADSFVLVKSSTIDFPDDIRCDADNNNLFIHLDNDNNIIWGKKPVELPVNTKGETKYQLVIKQIIKSIPNGGSITYPAIKKKLGNKVAGKISSHQIIEFFIRAKIDNKPISKTVKVESEEVNIFDTSGRLTVTFTNKSDDQ